MNRSRLRVLSYFKIQQLPAGGGVNIVLQIGAFVPSTNMHLYQKFTFTGKNQRW